MACLEYNFIINSIKFKRLFREECTSIVFNMWSNNFFILSKFKNSGNWFRLQIFRSISWINWTFFSSWFMNTAKHDILWDQLQGSTALNRLLQLLYAIIECLKCTCTTRWFTRHSVMICWKQIVCNRVFFLLHIFFHR